MRIDIKALIGENCITQEDGQKVFEQVHPELVAGHQVELDFNGVEVFASPFLNAAIGRLLKDIKADDLNRLLTISSLTSSGKQVLSRVIENSKTYFSDPDLRQALNDILTEQAENK